MATSTKRSFFYGFLFFIGLLGLGFALIFFVAYRNIPSINNINDCFKTSMFQVELCPKKSSYISFSQIPKHLVATLIASEDASFYFHKGFDWDEIKDSLEKSFDAGRWVRGGSTLTQQLAKNLYLNKEKSLVRKAKEFFIAKEIEKKLSKSQIIEKYLNVVEFGKNIYGLQKAAGHYFQKDARYLSPAEGAYLISLLPSPIRYSSAYHARKELSSYNKNRVERLLSLLRLQNKISEDDYQSEIARVEYGLWTPAPIPAEPSSLEEIAPSSTDQRPSDLEGNSSQQEAPVIDEGELSH